MINLSNIKNITRCILVAGCMFIFPYGLAAQSTLFIDAGNLNPSLKWFGESNVSYKIEYTTNLITEAWKAGGVAAIGVGSDIESPLFEILGTPFPESVFFRLALQYSDSTAAQYQDMLSPSFYNSTSDSSFRSEVNRFVYYSQKEFFHHPLEDESGQIPSFVVPANGQFGAGKGPGRTGEHHSAADLHVENNQTNVEMFAAHAGYVSTYRNALKYRDYLSISNDVVASNGDVLGKIVTLYAHIDLDLDEVDSLLMNGKYVSKGEVVSKHLYSGTMGGPHLHFEIRYYRPSDNGTETFSGFGGAGLTENAAGPWTYGYWNPDIGYGYGDSRNHGLSFY